MKKNFFKRGMAGLLSLVMCLTALVGIGTTTAYAAGERAEVYLVSFPRSGDANIDYSGTWGHPNLRYMNGWHSGESKYTTIRAMHSYDGNICYCIEPGVQQDTGDTYASKDETFWDNLPSDINSTISPYDIKLFIGRIMQYGYTGPISTSWRSQNPADAATLAEAMATQVLIWETVVGERDEDFDYVSPGSYDAVKGVISTAHPLYDLFCDYYDSIEASVQRHSAIPSFMSKNPNRAQSVELEWDGSLSRIRPHLVSEWSEKNLPLTPDTVIFGSNKIVWWKGSCGHEWQTSIKARSAGEQCPICSGARVLRGYNDFESKFPELAKEWSPKNEPLRPSMITAATHRKVIWQCKLGHEWTASVKSRTVNGTGCPYCSHNFVLPGFNDLASRFPEIAAEWSERNLPLTPDQVTAFKNIKVWWKCHLGHEWNTLISTRAGGSQCPYCSGIKLLKGFNDLQTKFPSLAIEWSDKNLPLTPDAVNEKSTKNVWWKCSTCGYEWKAVVKARVKGGMCPVCAERAVLQGYNDLGTTDPYLLSEWDFEKNTKWTPSNVSRNSMKVVWWKCGAGHSYRAKISDKTIEQKGCPQCEAEFQQALPQMLIMMYGAQNGITVKNNSDSELGVRLVAYLPELHCAVDIAGATVTEKREQSVKAHICQRNRLGYYLIKRTTDTSQMAAEIKTLFIRNHIYLHTDSEKDVQVLRERFLEWKNRNACKLNGKY